MNDKFTLYERGISRLLNALPVKNSQQLYLDVQAMQIQLARNITQARKYGSSPAQDADLNRIMEQLIELSLLATGKSFYEWCQVNVSTNQEQPDWSELRKEGFAQELLDTFIKLGAKPKEGQNLAHEDILERYISVPLHAIFLYTSEDTTISSYILDNWGALDSLSGSICDIHPLLEQFQNVSDAYEYIQQLDAIKKVSFAILPQLPCLFFWNHAGDTAYVSFGAEAKPIDIKNILRVVFEELFGEQEDHDAFPLSLSGQVYQCSADLLHRLHTFKYHYSDAYKQWNQSSTRFWKKRSMEAPRQHLIQTGSLRLPIMYTIGPLASGPLVIASSSFKKLLLQRNRSLLGIEMEANGVLAALNQADDRKKSLVLRGISDYGDERKAELDTIQQGALRQFAMHNTVQLFWKFLEVGLFPQNLQ